MRLSALLYMYRRRLRRHGLQELLAAVGIAIAVALVFAALLSESSIEASARRVVSTVTGPASLQLRARGQEGFPERYVGAVERLPGVRQAAPLLEQTATITAADGRHLRVQLAGTDLRLAVLDGLAETLPIGSLSTHGIGISEASAQALALSGKAGAHAHITLTLRGRSFPLRLTAILGHEAAGALAGAYAAVMPLSHMQRLAGLPGEVSRIFVQTRAGMRAKVAGELRALTGGRIEVAPANEDVALLAQALGPSQLASGLFAAIGALLGFLLAFNAMLLTVAERRRAIADLRVSGARRSTIVEMVLFEALCLAVPACLAGLAGGYLLSTEIFHRSTRYLAEAFTLSSATSLQPASIALPLAGGLIATLAASAIPLLDLRRGRPRDAIYAEDGVPGASLGTPARRRLALISLCLLIAATVLWLAIPSAAIPSTALIALATVLAVPLTFTAVLAGAGALGERLQRLSILPLALASLRSSALRSLALAATGAVALFGSIALGGSRQDLLDGIGTFARSYVADASIWVSNPGDNQAVQSFAPGDLARRISRVPGVVGVRAFQGGFTQVAGRRVWIIARAPAAERHVLESQIQEGSARLALARLARGGWIVASDQIASAQNATLGGTLTLPTPTGRRRYRLAATTTNLAWPPGVIFMSSAEYSRAFGSSSPTALGVQLSPGAHPAAVRRAIEAALPPGSGLEVALGSARAARIQALANEGLAQLQEVSTMLLIAAIVAMLAALGSSAWQRRTGLAGLRLFGASRVSLHAILGIEALLMLGAGCLTGAVAGVYGQVVIDAFLAHVTGFPLASPATSARPLVLFALVLLAALIAGAVPNWLAVRARPILALEGE